MIARRNPATMHYNPSKDYHPPANVTKIIGRAMM